MRDRLGDKARLEHALDAIDCILFYVDDLDFIEFCDNDLTQSACLHKLAVLGEALNRLSPELKESVTAIPWAQIIGLRNMIAHEYFGIDEHTIWNIIQYELPPLNTKLKEIASNLPNP